MWVSEDSRIPTVEDMRCPRHGRYRSCFQPCSECRTEDVKTTLVRYGLSANDAQEFLDELYQKFGIDL